jgi:hypothetical protein
MCALLNGLIFGKTFGFEQRDEIFLKVCGYDDHHNKYNRNSTYNRIAKLSLAR